MSMNPDVKPQHSIMDWPAILAGAAIAAGAMVVFTGFTTAIGLGSVSAEPGEGLGTFAAILVGLFSFLTTLASFGLGGYIAGRMRTPAAGIPADETRARDGVHGLTVWAIGTLVGAFLTFGLVSGTVRAVGSAASTAVEAGGSAVGGALQGAGQLAGGVVGGAGQLAGGVISGVGQAAGGAIQGAGEAAGGAGGLQDILPQGLQQNPLDYLANRLLRPAEDANATYSDAAIRNEIMGIIGTVLRTGELPQDDRDYLVRALAARTQLSQQEIEARIEEAVIQVQDLRREAEQRLEQAQTQAQEAIDAAQAEAERLQQEAQQQLEQARQAAIDAAEAARSAAVWTAFLLAASALIAGVVAFLAAIRGGHDRDQGRIWAGLHRGLRNR